jgi:hypothetical protein
VVVNETAPAHRTAAPRSQRTASAQLRARLAARMVATRQAAPVKSPPTNGSVDGPQPAAPPLMRCALVLRPSQPCVGHMPRQGRAASLDWESFLEAPIAAAGSGQRP